MEQKLVRVPFEVELAKEITNGTKEGRIVTRGGDEARIVCWDYKSMSGDYPILALINQGKQEEPIPYSKEGQYNVYGYFSEDCLDLMLKIPEYLTFKDGDVISYEGGTLILKKIDGKDRVEYYANLYGIYTAFDSACLMKNLVNHLRISTEEEKRKLIVSMKESKEPKAKEYLKRFFNIEQMQEYKFKPFDKVLVKDDDENSAWSCNLFSGKNEDGTYMCIGGYWDMCIPYNESTAHLLGTTEDFKL